MGLLTVCLSKRLTILAWQTRRLRLPFWRARETKRALSVQAALSDAAAKEQEGYRGYLLRRLVPAMTAHYEEEFLAMDDLEAADSLREEGVMQRLASLTTRQLERRLAHFHQALLMVRKADVLQASILRF